MKRNVLIAEKSRKTPVVHEADICVVGGSCTGVFAAVRAARLGAKVAIIEKQNSFGGVATQGLVNVWHSLMDSEYKYDVIGGLTREVVDRLAKRDAVLEKTRNAGIGFILNTEELKIELDELVGKHNIKAYLHTLFAAPHFEDGKLDAVIIENKSGRSAVRAKVFIDATGDGDLAFRLGFQTTLKKHLQPPTTCARILGTSGISVADLIRKHREEFNLPKDWGWSAGVVGMPGVTMHAETHVFNANCADADELTYAEIEGRRQVRAYMDIVRKYTDRKPVLADIASYIGVRETRHVDCLHRLTEKELLEGRKFEDAIAYGSYRVDVHHEDRPGITFRYLDGRESVFEEDSGWKESRWRPESEGITPFYQIPYRSIVPKESKNVLIAGRMLDADTGAYGAVRVMVTCNQTGEAAGVAAAIAADKGIPVDKVDACELRKVMGKGGSIIL
ncbi:MAG: FAD-dependent oxidoreductase [Victivallales bacterium]|jgi:hypothetical protein